MPPITIWRCSGTSGNWVRPLTDVGFQFPPSTHIKQFSGTWTLSAKKRPSSTRFSSLQVVVSPCSIQSSGIRKGSATPVRRKDVASGSAALGDHFSPGPCLRSPKAHHPPRTQSPAPHIHKCIQQLGLRARWPQAYRALSGRASLACKRSLSLRGQLTAKLMKQQVSCAYRILYIPQVCMHARSEAHAQVTGSVPHIPRPNRSISCTDSCIPKSPLGSVPRTKLAYWHLSPARSKTLRRQN